MTACNKSRSELMTLHDDFPVRHDAEIREGSRK